MTIRNDAFHSESAATFTAASSDSLWLCLHFAQLALDIFDQQESTRPLAVIEHRRVHCANRDNLYTGLAIATAHALHPDLIALERKPECEREHLFQLAHWAYQFTPGVVIANRNSLLLEIGSCRQLYRGAHNILKQLRRSLVQRKQHAAFGLARTPKAAWLLAQCDCKPALDHQFINDDLLNDQLAAVPISCLEIAEETQIALKQMGLSKFGELKRLPTIALGKRFGMEFVDYLQKVAGTTIDPQLFFTPLPRFQAGLSFVDGILQRQMLLFPMKRLLQMLDDYLRSRQLYCHTLQWQIFDAHRLQADFSLELSRTKNGWQNLLELSRIKLDQITLNESVFSINLMCADFFETAPTAQQLFPDENDQREAAAALIDRLQARLGKEALQQIVVQDSHWPEMAWQCTEVNKKKMAPTISRSSPLFAATVVGMDADTEPPGRDLRRVVANDGDERHTPNLIYRPLWLLSQPQQIPQRDNQPCWPTPLTLLRGPERIGNHWWEEEASERDYYIARNARGIVCWIYCDRNSQQWFLHGLFA